MISWTCLFPPPQAEEIEVFENDSKTVLPGNYREFLMEVNGGRSTRDACFVIPETGDQVMLGVLYGVTNDLASNLSLLSVWKESGDVLPSGFVQIGEDPGGNRLLISVDDTNPGCIYFLERAGFIAKRVGKSLFKVSASIDEFIDSLREF